MIRWSSWFRIGLLVVLAVTSGVGRAHAQGLRLTGQVVDAATQTPVAGAEVEVRNAGGGPGYHRTRTDANGTFTLERIAADRWYAVSVLAAGYSAWAVDNWQFPAAQREARITVPLDRAGRIEVAVRGSEGRALAGARVNLRRDRGNHWWEAVGRDPEPRWTDAAGRVTFEGLAAGAWTANVDAAGRRPEEARAIPVQRGGTTPVTLTLVRPASVSGTVRLADSTAVGGVLVTVRGPAEGSAMTDAEGHFTVTDLPPGRYRVELTDDGFERGTARDGIVLAEGQAVGGGALVARPRVASLAFVLERDVFVPAPVEDGGASARVTLGVRAFRVGAFDAVLHRVPVERVIAGRMPGADAADTSGLVRVAAWRHVLPDGAPFAWREAQMTLPQELSPGAYVLTARAGNVVRRQVFFVSELSLLVKRSGTRLAAWVGSLRTGAPLPGVQLYVRTAGADRFEDATGMGRALALAGARVAITPDDGLAWIPGTLTADEVTVIAVSDRGGVAVVRSPLAPRSAVSGDQVFLFTDRPLVRPGQSVNWKLFARKGGASGYALPDAADVTLSLQGPGQSLTVPATAMSASGSASGTIALPADAPLGDWTLSARVGAAEGQATFGVQAYRKPEYRVAVAPDREVSVNGDEVRFTVAADYFFGAPVAGASVRWTLFESRLSRESRWDAWDPWGDAQGGEGEDTGYGRMLESGETRTDLDGRVALSFAPARVAYDRRLSLEVEVLDGAQRMVSARGTALMGRGQFRVRVVPVARLFMAGQPIVADVFTEDLRGNPVQAAFTVEVDQDVWNPIERRTTRSSRPLVSLDATTSALQGRARVTLPLGSARAGDVTLRARAVDARGNTVSAEQHVWVYDARVWDYAYRYPTFEAVPDRDAWSPGDTARILVNADVKDASVLVSVEGRELHELRVQPLVGRTGLVRVPIRAGYGPNLFVKLHLRRGREIQTRTLELPIRTERHDLRVQVTSDRAEYRPREAASFTVETRDAAGRPVAAELALGVVDEAIYSLRPDRTARAHDVFYGRIADAVTTVAAFPVLYYGGVDKGESGDARRDFRDVALWAPDVRTGADGRAQVTLTWPDNLTTWRATARGVTANTLVGETTAQTRVTQDLVARLAVPRTLTAGDRATLVSVVTNRTRTAFADVKESLALRGAARATGAGTQTGGLAPLGESRHAWPIEVVGEAPRDGGAMRATLTFRAQVPSGGDAIEQELRVRPRTVALRTRGAGASTGANAPVTVTLPDALVRTGSGVRVQVVRSLAGVVDAAAASLGDFPFGCTEQTASALAGGLVRARSAGTRDDARLAAHVQRLASLANDDGLWGWWPRSESSPELTAVAAAALVRAGQAQVQPELVTSLLDRAQWGLVQQATRLRSLETEAWWLMHVSTIATLPDAATRWPMLSGQLASSLTQVTAQSPQLSPAARACAAIACARLGRTAEAQRLLEAAWAGSVTEANGRLLPAGSDDEPWIAEAIERTAWAIEAAALVAPQDPRAAQAVASLVARRDGREWRSTRVTAAVVTALDAWLATHPVAPSEGAVRVTWDGIELPLDASGWANVPSERLASGAHAVAVAVTGPGTVWWSWESVAQVASPGPTPDRSRVQVTREYLRAVRTADLRGRPRWLSTPLDAGQPLRVGEAVLVRLTFTAARDLRWVAVQDPVPGGFEIDQVLPEGVERPWDVFGEARDGEAAFYLDTLPSGTTVVEYLVRPELAGRFVALPTAAFGMYDPSLATRGGEQVLIVEGK